MTPKLEQELTKLKHGDHICSIYENEAEQLAASIPVIVEGLARGERCIYIADNLTVEEIVQALRAAGVDVERERQRDALRLLTRADTCIRTGEFAPQAMIDFIRQAEAEALADGFSGLRQMGEMSWVLGSEPGCDRLIEFEALVNRLLINSKIVGLCQYKRSRFDVACIHDVFRTHPLVILCDQVFPNPHYEPPELALSPEGQASAEFKQKRMTWWIAQLKRARKAEQEREHALEKLKRSERRLAEAQQIAHIGSWERDLRTNEVTWSDELYSLFGLQANAIDLSYQQFLDFLAPQDVDRIRALVEKAIRDRSHFSCDYRITRADGGVRVLHDRGGVILNEEGEPIRLVGTAQDVSELRQAEQARQEYAAQLQALSRRLLEVQEEERRHLARELHDEVGQLLTGLRLLLKPAGDAQAGAGSSRLEQAQAIVDQLLDKVRSLSFDLRPAVLDQLGLMPALHELFENYTKQTGVHVHFQHQDVEGRFAPDVETTAYRIVQQALTNVARHAGPLKGGVTVRVWTTEDRLSVQIEDRGRGFDAEAVLATPRSSGLAGMRERVMLLQGELAIDSRPGAGTQITAELPLGRPTGEETR
jgi:PAS domain S-box-containing protein